MPGVRRIPAAGVTAATAIAALVAAGCSSSRHHAAPASPANGGGTTIAVSVTQCGAGWTHPKVGHQEFRLRNTDTRGGEVFLVNAKTGAVFGYVEPLGPGTTANLAVDLTGGQYAFRCVMQDNDAVTGPTVTLTGTAKVVSPSVLPVSQQQLIGPTQQYEKYVTRALPGLATLADRLRDDLARGDLRAARADWLPAHLAYERLGAAYGAFGDADGAINGLPNGLPGGVQDRDFTGFHRVEYGLWHGQSARVLRPIADALARAVAGLRKSFAAAQIDPLEVAIRAHEITENALQFELTGQTDFGSHSDLATVRANLDGTETVLGFLGPLLKTRYPALPQLHRRLTQAEHDLDPVRAKPLDALARLQRELINADISELSELLAPVAAICEPRRTS
jgi:iron uptake system component EfeO